MGGGGGLSRELGDLQAKIYMVTEGRLGWEFYP